MHDQIDSRLHVFEWFDQTTSSPRGSLKLKDVSSMKPNIDFINQHEVIQKPKLSGFTEQTSTCMIYMFMSRMNKTFYNISNT